MSKAILKRFALPALLLAAGMTALFLLLGMLGRYDYMLITFRTPVSWTFNKTLDSALGLETETALFTRSENGFLTADWNKWSYVTVYTCSEKFFEISAQERISGRFLWDSDAEKRGSYAVIDENLAVLLYAGKSCIGEKFTLGGKSYTVAGVCGSENGLMTSVDEYAVYLPMDAYAAQNTQYGCLLRSENDLSLTFSLQGNHALLSRIGSTDNLEVRSGMWSIPAQLALLLIWLLALITVIKALLRYAALLIERIRGELKSLYPREYLKKHLWGILLHLLGFAALCAAFVFWFRVMRLGLVIDATLIPKSLIDIGGWLEKIGEYLRVRNTALRIPFSPSLKIGVYGWISVFVSIVSVYAAVMFLRAARAAITAFLDSRREEIL